MDKISSTRLELFQDKENQNHLSYLSLSSLNKTRIRLTELTDIHSSSESEDLDVDLNLASLAR